MPESLDAHQLIQLAQCLTRVQSAVTDYELRHYAELSVTQKRRLEETLSQLVIAAGRMYAFSVQLEFQDAETDLRQLNQAYERLNKFLKTAKKIQQAFDIVGSVASPAEAIISHDVGGISAGINQIIQLVANN